MDYLRLSKNSFQNPSITCKKTIFSKPEIFSTSELERVRRNKTIKMGLALLIRPPFGLFEIRVGRGHALRTSDVRLELPEPNFPRPTVNSQTKAGFPTPCAQNIESFSRLIYYLQLDSNIEYNLLCITVRRCFELFGWSTTQRALAFRRFLRL